MTYRNSLHGGVRLVIGLLMIGVMIGMPSSQGHVAAQSIATRLQVLHGGTEVGKVEVFVNGDKVLDNFEYASVSDWIDVDPGTVRLTITRDRAGFNYAIYDMVVPMQLGHDYYAIITDALVLSGAFDTSQVAEGMGRVQVAHASVDAPAVNVTATNGDISAAKALRYSQASAAVDAPSGTYDFDISIRDTGQSLLTTPGIEIETGNSYLIALIGNPSDSDKPLQTVVLKAAIPVVGPATPVASLAG